MGAIVSLSLSLSLSLSPMSNETQQKARRSDSFDSSNRSVLTSLSFSHPHIYSSQDRDDAETRAN